MKKLNKIIVTIVKLTAIVGAIGGVAYLGQKANKKDKELLQRYKAYYSTTNQWLMNNFEGKKVETYFAENKLETIALYGFGSMGELFLEEIKKANVKVSYIIDKKAEGLSYDIGNIRVIGLDDIKNQEPVDAIIVTPIFDFEEILDDLQKISIDAEIISLEDIIHEI